MNKRNFMKNYVPVGESVTAQRSGAPGKGSDQSLHRDGLSGALWFVRDDKPVTRDRKSYTCYKNLLQDTTK